MVKQVQYDHIKKGQLAKTFQGQEWEWYMKFLQVSMGHPQIIIAQIRAGLIQELKKPKPQLQYITELNYIKQFPMSRCMTSINDSKL